MTRATNRLTALGIDKLKTRSRHADGLGLWLNVGKTGGKSWVFRWTPRGGKVREMGLGPYPAMSLSNARKKAFEYRQMVANGLDPKRERDKQHGKTFGDVADAYLVAMQPRWTHERSRAQWKTTLTTDCAPIRNRQVADIETADILLILNPIWSEIPETASRVRNRIEGVLDYAKAKNWREGDNPARWRGHLSKILPARQKLNHKHHAAMAYSELPGFWPRLNDMEALSARALELLILTAARTGEILYATWDEFDLDNALWVIPAVRMKAQRDHRVPLTNAALAILKPLYENRVSHFVFPGQKPRKPLSDNAMKMLIKRMKIKSASIHGFRSTFRDWCGDETSFPREIAEAALAHKVGSDVEQAYRRSDALEKRRRLMEAWAEYCTEKNANNVVVLRG
jgi:integrase